MGVYIRGMEMPSNCDDCKLRNGMGKDDGKVIYHCAPLAKWVVPNPLAETNDCPLVPVPPHGRLIDADALYRTIDATSERTIGHTTFKETVLLDIRGMPTILESTIGQLNSDSAVNEAEEGE